MATFTLSVDCSNAAFVDHDVDPYVEAMEIARILREAADSVERGKSDMRFPQPLRDINGNGVGHYQLKD